MTKRIWFVALTALVLGVLSVAGARAQGLSLALGDRGYRGGCAVAEPKPGPMDGAGGGASTLGLKPHDSIMAWRDNYCGECNAPGPNTRSISDAAGTVLHGLGLKDDGSILAWGYSIWIKMRNIDLAGIGTNPRLSLDVNPVGKPGLKLALKMMF